MPMLQIRCADAGTVCPGVVQAFTREELHRQLANHLNREHRVRTPTQTIMHYMAGLAETVEEPAPAGKEKR
jgi:predicted small metal-binding protein